MRISPVRASTLLVVASLFGCGDPLKPLHVQLCEHDCDAGRAEGDGGATGGTCDDGKMNNDETDIDCGGECEKCENDKGCGLDVDCASGMCVNKMCLLPPTAAFTLSVSMGALPSLSVSATNGAVEGSSPIVDISYDWDDGQGFEPASSPLRHTYRTGGGYTVRQRIRDENGQVAYASQPLEVVDNTNHFRQARFSGSDLTSGAVLLSPDRMSVEHRGIESGGVRSDVSVLPMSGVYYFEAERLIQRTGNYGFGVATAAEQLSNEIGHDPQSMGVATFGGVFNNNPDGQDLMNCTGRPGVPIETKQFGFVVDYRAANPRVHLIIDRDGAPTVNTSCTMGVTEALHIFYTGSRYEIGYQARINTGADTTNHPFHFSLAQLVTALNTASQSIPMADIVYGFGGTRAQPKSTPPVLNAPGDQTIAFGRTVMLSATASDPEDPDSALLTGRITWLDTASQHYTPVESVGGTFMFKPNAIGRHPIRVSVRDSSGLVTSKVVTVEVTGELTMPDPVVLAPDDFGGAGVKLSDDGLSAHFFGAGKYGIRANQGIYKGSFQYFEAHREHPSGNMGVGVIIGDGSLNPYHFEDVPWSCSVNLTGNTWRNLIDQTIWMGADYDRYGFAVDYRGDHPIVYVLIGSGHTATLESTLTLDDIWVPIYPMVYGNPQDIEGPDISINFGAQPFQFDPRAVVPGGSAMQLGWGVHAH